MSGDAYNSEKLQNKKQNKTKVRINTLTLFWWPYTNYSNKCRRSQ